MQQSRTTGRILFFSLFVKRLCQYSEYSHWHTGNSVNRDALCPFGEEKNKDAEKTNNDMVHEFESQRATNLGGMTADRNTLPSTV